ncbi:MAG TPA: glycosyltransferase N-terminal domain-containing protein [Humidesulfovibrio sp.]|uniref:3-deoxy-D-manno-octulosonic acid transferase n=1 Tax=Humidesulfovibrio sp. TaxID=2910988 RepID=UPI002D15CCA6|nr:glycosyltransferase N-terminal domain-containing protein [Humidesulfovibrio sp.]HWR03055.1 glycosyltransferase N-terminal domain-containing protein [Humidesulfovibrio sp.]
MSAPGTLPVGISAMLGLYGLAWRAALYGLRRNKRLREGWEQRTLAAGPPPKADLWIQAASGGEAYLAWELLRQLPEFLPAERRSGKPKVLVTTFTSQGMAVLQKAAQALAGSVELVPAWFPFDLPGRMDRALAAVAPKAVVLLETELWPGLMAACRKQDVPCLVVNARMTHKSLAGYSRMPGFWRALGPKRVLAVSDDDAGRFAKLFPDARTGVMLNIKFDRLDFTPAPARPELAALLPDPSTSPFIVLGSVRKQEEAEVLEIVKGLLAKHPQAVIGLFPRHMERVEAWSKLLRKAGIPLARRSAGEAARPGTVLLWDAFGELGAAFGLARACFLGGSLADLGGQNFLEPLAHGIVPVIGPSWSNFVWVGEEIFHTGLVRREADWQGVLGALCALAENAPLPQAVRAEAELYAQSRRGGSRAACQAVAEYLICG